MRQIKFTVRFHAKVESFLFKQNAAYPARDRGLRILRNIQKALEFIAFTIGFFRLDLTDYKFRVEMF